MKKNVLQDFHICISVPLTVPVSNIVLLVAVVTESVYYANVNTTPQFERNTLI